MDYLIYIEGAALPYRVVRFGKVIAYTKNRRQATAYQVSK